MYNYGTKRKLRKRKSSYTLPSGPRGDSPSGTYNRGRPWGRTGDMQYGYNSTPLGQRRRGARARYERGKNIPGYRREAYRRA